MSNTKIQHLRSCDVAEYKQVNPLFADDNTLIGFTFVNEYPDGCVIESCVTKYSNLILFRRIIRHYFLPKWGRDYLSNPIAKAV